MLINQNLRNYESKKFHQELAPIFEQNGSVFESEFIRNLESVFESQLYVHVQYKNKDSHLPKINRTTINIGKLTHQCYIGILARPEAI